MKSTVLQVIYIAICIH